VESTVGLGTTVHIFLPAAEKSVSPAAEPALPQGNGETVLVINDGSGGRDLLRPFLEHHRYRVLVARDGLEGIGRLRAHLKEIDAVVIEMVMSATAKLELIHSLHRLKPGLPVIAVVEAAEDSRQLAGVCTTLRKPAEPRQLLSALRQALSPAASP
jgi:CheY-like chemotaxis protein